MTTDLFDLSGKVALVTGGNGGIGLGMATAVATAGANVAVWGTNPDKNAAAKEQLSGIGIEAESYVCNVADAADVNRAMAATLARFGRIDACFSNAGVTGRGAKSFLDITPDDWRRVMSVNLDGAFIPTRPCSGIWWSGRGREIKEAALLRYRAWRPCPVHHVMSITRQAKVH